MSKEAPIELFYRGAARQLLRQFETAAVATGEGRWQVYDWLVRQELTEPAEALRDIGEDEAANWLTSYWAQTLPQIRACAISRALELSRNRGDHLQLSAVAA
jgi:hypothetical protein